MTFMSSIVRPIGAPASIGAVTLPLTSAGWRLDRALAVAWPTLSRERLKALIAGGAVAWEGGVLARDPAFKVRGGEALRLHVPEPATAEARPQEIALTVAYEDAHLLVIDKPAGLVVHPAAGHADGTLVNALLHHCQGSLSGIGGVARPGIVHRIDKDTSGLLVVAKTDPAHEGLARQFAAHIVERRYVAVVSGTPAPPAGRIEGNLARSAHNRHRMTIVDQGRGRHAVTHYRTMQPLRGAAVVECRLETGRTHQVRAHMLSIGHPLVGDALYGRPGAARAVLARLGFARQALHAAVLGFVHPVTGNFLRFESETPCDMKELIASLAF